MLTSALEEWRSRMQGSDPMHAELAEDPFYSRMLLELNDLSHVLELVYRSDNLSQVQQELDRVVQRHKPTGSAQNPNVCPRCGKKYP